MGHGSEGGDGFVVFHSYHVICLLFDSGEQAAVAVALVGSRGHYRRQAVAPTGSICRASIWRLTARTYLHR